MTILSWPYSVGKKHFSCFNLALSGWSMNFTGICPGLFSWICNFQQCWSMDGGFFSKRGNMALIDGKMSGSGFELTWYVAQDRVKSLDSSSARCFSQHDYAIHIFLFHLVGQCIWDEDRFPVTLTGKCKDITWWLTCGLNFRAISGKFFIFLSQFADFIGFVKLHHYPHHSWHLVD